MGIANRDIKLENTLLMDKTERPLVKLCDFGYSKDEYQGSACKTLCGEWVFHTYSPCSVAAAFQVRSIARPIGQMICMLCWHLEQPRTPVSHLSCRHFSSKASTNLGCRL